MSGFGVGVGSQVILGAVGTLYASDSGRDQGERMAIRPFPKHPIHGMEPKEFWTKYRGDMLATAGVAIFISGNKRLKDTTKVGDADGMLEEFAISKRLRLYPIPIGATGHAAEKIWEDVNANLNKFYPSLGIKAHFATLGDYNKSEVQIIEAIVGILKQIKAI